MEWGRSFSVSQRYPPPSLPTTGIGRNGASRACTPTAPAPGPPPPCGVREGLVQVHMDDVEAHVAGPHLAQDRVQVRAVVVQEPARIVHDARDLLDAALEHAERRRIRQHDAGRPRADRGLERLKIDVALGVHGDLAHGIAAHRRGRGVRAVRRVGDDDFVARAVAARMVIRADHRHAGEFALGAGHGAQGDAFHPGHALQEFLQLVQTGEESLAVYFRRERVPREELGQHRVLITGLRVVFHRARAERIEVRVDAEIALRQAREVPHGVELADLRERGALCAAKALRQVRRCVGVLGARPLIGRAAAGYRVFEDQVFTVVHGGPHAVVRGFGAACSWRSSATR